MVPYRYSLNRYLFPFRYFYSELRDGVRRRFRRVKEYDPDADLCGRFAICLEKNGFEKQAESVWKIGSSDRWEDHAHAHAFAEAVIMSGDKEAARIGAEILSDCLEHLTSRPSKKAARRVNLAIKSLRTMVGHHSSDRFS